MSKLWTREDELHAIALGELMEEWRAEHPADDDTRAYDAVCFQVGRRTRELMKEEHRNVR